MSVDTVIGMQSLNMIGGFYRAFEDGRGQGVQGGGVMMVGLHNGFNFVQGN